MTALLDTCEPTDDIEPIRTQLDSAIDQLALATSHPDDVPFLAELRNAARGDGLELPQLPEDLARVRLVLADPGAGPRDLARAIRHNPVVAAQFVALANSAYFSGRHRIEHLDEAIVRVGMKQAAAWVTALITEAALFLAVGYRHQAKEVFRHALASAVNAQLIADLHVPSYSADAFIMALLHDFGRVYILAIAGGQDIETSVDRGAPSTSMLERASDTLHAGFSALIARSWAFDKKIVSAILDHHAALEEASDDDSDTLLLTRILQAADEMGHRMIDAVWENERPDPTTIDLLGTFETIDELLEDAQAAYSAFESVLS